MLIHYPEGWICVELVCVCMDILPASRLKCASASDSENAVCKNLVWLKSVSEVSSIVKSNTCKTFTALLGYVLLVTPTIQGGFTLPGKGQALYCFTCQWYICAV